MKSDLDHLFSGFRVRGFGDCRLHGLTQRAQNYNEGSNTQQQVEALVSDYNL